MKKLLLALLVALFANYLQAQVNIPYQELSYDVHYHWGLVNVNIAHGVVKMQTQGNNFVATLDGNSIPWEGRVFCVSDTLKATMTPSQGLSKETVTYENGWYLKPKVMEFRSKGFNPSNPANYKNIKGEGTLDADGNTMEAITVTTDMLGMFYYFREIDFESMAPGNRITIPIAVENGQSQQVVVTYEGKSSYQIEGTTYRTYKTRFEYSYNGAMSGYPVEAQVGVNDRLPLLLSASLPVGKVEMVYAP